jgi:saccharopine dehydrogenase (NAD+, L-lysine-forming)
VFSVFLLASRTLSRCEAVAASVAERHGRRIATAGVDADRREEVAALMRDFKPDLCVNVALPYQDLTIMDACLECGVDYLDTANYEPPDEARFEYGWQWAYHDRFREAGIMALLGSGFDPGVTNVFCAYAQKHLFDRIRTIDILDCNAGDHGHPFATNFNPEINIREVTGNGRWWENGEWIETGPLERMIEFDYPEVGPRKSYLMYHEELESLVKHIPGLERIRFWMTFSDEYLKHLEVLRNVGLTSIEPVEFEGREIVPLKFLKALLPDPAGLGAGYRGKTVIGCVFSGERGGRRRRAYIYNVCDHAACFREVGAQAVSYTTGVPAMIGAMMILTGKWRGAGVFNMEEFDPDPFMDALGRHGLPWTVSDFHGSI